MTWAINPAAISPLQLDPFQLEEPNFPQITIGEPPLVSSDWIIGKIVEGQKCKMHLPIYEPDVHQKYLLETQPWQFYEERHQININYRPT